MISEGLFGSQSQFSSHNIQEHHYIKTKNKQHIPNTFYIMIDYFLSNRLYAGCKAEWSFSIAGWSEHRVQYCTGAAWCRTRLPLRRLQCQTLPEPAVLRRHVEETRVQVYTVTLIHLHTHNTHNINTINP